MRMLPQRSFVNIPKHDRNTSTGAGCANETFDKQTIDTSKLIKTNHIHGVKQLKNLHRK